jgi:hypothetical protein
MTIYYILQLFSSRVLQRRAINADLILHRAIMSRDITRLLSARRALVRLHLSELISLSSSDFYFVRLIALRRRADASLLYVEAYR